MQTQKSKFHNTERKEEILNTRKKVQEAYQLQDDIAPFGQYDV